MSRRLFVGIGVLLWALATTAFRLAGQVFFLDGEPGVLAILWLLTIAAMLGLAGAIFRWRKLTRAQRFEAAALLVIPGMILDALATEGFAAVFPNMPEAAAGSFGAWLLMAYACVLVSAFIPARGQDSSATSMRGKRSQNPKA